MNAYGVRKIIPRYPDTLCKSLSPLTMVVVVRKNLCSLGHQGIFMVQSAKDRVSYNFAMARSAMLMFVRRDWKIASRIGAQVIT